MTWTRCWTLLVAAGGQFSSWEFPAPTTIMLGYQSLGYQKHIIFMTRLRDGASFLGRPPQPRNSSCGCNSRALCGANGLIRPAVRWPDRFHYLPARRP